MNKYAIGLDFGTLSVRALLLNAETGAEEAASVFVYPHAVMDRALPGTDARFPDGWALQHPQDYLDGLAAVVHGVMEARAVAPEAVIGIGVDFTASTVMPVLRDGTPLCFLDEYRREPHAYAKLWKHHGAEAEAAQIDRIARSRGEAWMAYYGNKVSSEWMIPKLLETLHKAPELYAKADRFIEAMDWIIWQMTGIETRSACGAGYKAFRDETAGYPSGDFFAALDPAFESVAAEKLESPIKAVGERAGFLCAEMAKKLGLAAGTPVAAGIIDAHASVIGAGISRPGTMMLIVGTSSCHMMLSDKKIAVEGINGVVKDGILPGYYAYEAGQSCVGDSFAWFVENCVPERYMREAAEKGMNIHALLRQKLEDIRPGQSGLIALDWFNGVRSPLMDFDLTGMILGMNLNTKPEEIYLSLIEATAYGTRMILEGFAQAGIPVSRIILGGGIPAKDKRLVQVYADVCGCEIEVAGSPQISARGAAILGVAAADPFVSGYASIYDAVEKLGSGGSAVYRPIPENQRVYEQLYREYAALHAYFGRGANDVMKRLKRLRQETRKD